MTVLPDDRIVKLVAELKASYKEFTWESELWAQHGHRRSPYRTLVLFGLSARTRDALLAEMCREFFRRFPNAPALSERRKGLEEEVRSIVRAGQLPVVVSIAEVVSKGVPRNRDSLMQINGVGEKIAECVLAYGWGQEALPLDANCVRVLARILGLDGKESSPATLREGLKFLYRRCRQQFIGLAVSMVDVHEMLRLHGQMCCARRPECSRCPVTHCLSRREQRDQRSTIEMSPSIWDDWRELIYEPSAV